MLVQVKGLQGAIGWGQPDPVATELKEHYKQSHTHSPFGNYAFSSKIPSLSVSPETNLLFPWRPVPYQYPIKASDLISCGVVKPVPALPAYPLWVLTWTECPA